MEQVKQLLGHSTIRVTSDTYGDLFEGHEVPLRSALSTRRERARAAAPELGRNAEGTRGA
jgi:hypothetical protein